MSIRVLQGVSEVDARSEPGGWENAEARKILGVGPLRLMDDHDQDRALTILYATESGGAQDAANKIARRCRNLSFGCRNIDVRDYPLVRVPFLSRFIGRLSEEPGLIIRLWECAVGPRPRNSRNICRFDDGLRTRT